MAKNGCGQTEGPCWGFTTIDCGPPAPTNPSPADGAADVSVSTDLSWSGGGGLGVQSAGTSLLQNGGFETGNFSGWTIVTGPGGQFQPWTLAAAGSGIWFHNGTPSEGLRFAQNGFDGDAGLYYDIYQQVAIPGTTASARLEWSDRLQWITTYGATVARPYTVTLQPAGGGAPLATLFSTTVPPGTTGDTGYVAHSIDLLSIAPGVAGQTVRINFHQSIPESHTGPAQFDLDGASLTVVEGAATYDVYMGPDCGSMTKVASDLNQPTYDPPGSLQEFTTYYWKVVAKNTCGSTDGPCWSFTTEASTITKPADGASVDLKGVIVSAAFPDFFYIEMDTRACGIRAQKPAHGLTAGTRVNAAGVVRTNANGERYIDVSDATAVGSAGIAPLGIVNKALGGGDWLYDPMTGAGQQGVFGWRWAGGSGGAREHQWLKSTDLNNIGLLVNICGKVTACGRDWWFYLDDGSDVRDGTGIVGIYCETQPGVTPPTAGSYVSVVGISSCEFYNGNLVNVLRVRGQDDITIISSPPEAKLGLVPEAGIRPRNVPKTD